MTDYFRLTVRFGTERLQGIADAIGSISDASAWHCNQHSSNLVVLIRGVEETLSAMRMLVSERIPFDCRMQRGGVI